MESRGARRLRADDMRYDDERRRMIEKDLAGRGIRDERVLTAMREVPRELFVDPEYLLQAHADSALPIAEGQTISQPFVVALMLEAAQVQPSDTVLEVGAGSGYVAAILSRLAARVFALERHTALVETARNRLTRLGITNVQLEHGDGTRGWPAHAPFDSIIVSAGGSEIPPSLREQLAIGGRLVIPIGAVKQEQRLLILHRVDEGSWKTRDLGPVQFVPLVADERICMRTVAEGYEREFASVRSGADRAIAQLDAAQLRRTLDSETNSIAVVMKHVAGNLRSRFTDFLDTDGEKPWRARDDEFIDDLPAGEAGRAAVFEQWNAGWQVLFDTLATLNDSDMPRTVRIRGEVHSVARALARSLAHLAYHQGQIVQIARTIVGPAKWKVLSIPRGASDTHNRAMGYDPPSGQSSH